MHRLLQNIEEVLAPGEDRERWQYHSLRITHYHSISENAIHEQTEPTPRWVLVHFCAYLKTKGVHYPLSCMPVRPTAWGDMAPRLNFRLRDGKSLRADQLQATEVAIRNVTSQKRGGHMLMPPGWGKTWVALSIAGAIGLPCAFLMQSTELLLQFMLSLFRDFDIIEKLGGRRLQVGAIINEDKAKELGDFHKYVDFGTGPVGFSDVRVLFVGATAMRHMKATRPHCLESVRGRFGHLFVDEAHQVAPNHDGDETSSMLIQSIEELVTPTASVLAFTQGFDRQDGFLAYLNNMFRWSAEVQGEGGILYRAYHYEVGRMNFTMNRIAVEATSCYTAIMKNEMKRQARENPASTDYLEKLSWQLEANRMAVVFATVTRQRAAGRTIMVFLDYRSAVYAYAEIMLSLGSNVVVMTGCLAEDRQQVSAILTRRYPGLPPAEIREMMQKHTVSTRECLKVRARMHGRTSTQRIPGELPLLMLVTKSASVGLDVVEVSSAMVVSSCDAARQRLQQIAGRCGRGVDELRIGSQLIRKPDTNKSSIITLLHCPRMDYVVHDAQYTESHREDFFHSQIWESLRITLGNCRCGHARHTCIKCAAVCQECRNAPVAGSMPHRMLCIGCLGGDYVEGSDSVCFFPTRVAEGAGGDTFESRLATPTFDVEDTPKTYEEAKCRIACDVKEQAGGTALERRLIHDAGGWHDPMRVSAAFRAGEMWLSTMDVVYVSSVACRQHTSRNAD